MAHSFNRHVKICTEADLANAQRIAWKLYRPEPRQPTRTKTGYGGATLEDLAADSAMEIGLLPRLAREKFTQVGNAAGVGVARMLASTAERKLAREIAARCAYVELSTNPQFQKRFMKNIGFSSLAGERAS